MPGANVGAVHVGATSNVSKYVLQPTVNDMRPMPPWTRAIEKGHAMMVE